MAQIIKNRHWIAVATVSCWAGVAFADQLEGLTIFPTGGPTHFRYEYKPQSGEAIAGYFAFPESVGPYRVVIVNHGPNADARRATYSYAPSFLERGYATFAVDLQYAKAVEESDLPAIFGRLQACLHIIEHDDRFDSKQVYMFGNGPGAMVTLAFAAQTDKLRAIALTGSGMLPKSGIDFEKVTSPVIMVHGEKDQTAPLESALQLKADLNRARKTVEMKTIKTSGHEVITLKKADVFDEIVGFFNKYGK